MLIHVDLAKYNMGVPLSLDLAVTF